jgi:hypothetical protein
MYYNKVRGFVQYIAVLWKSALDRMQSTHLTSKQAIFTPKGITQRASPAPTISFTLKTQHFIWKSYKHA